MNIQDVINTLHETVENNEWNMDSISSLIISAYEKGLEDESHKPLSEWMEDRDDEELMNMQKFIAEELSNRGERQFTARFDWWERTAEND